MLTQLCSVLLLYCTDFCRDNVAIKLLRTNREIRSLRTRYSLKECIVADEDLRNAIKSGFIVRRLFLYHISELDVLKQPNLQSFVTHITFGAPFDDPVYAHSLPPFLTHLTLGSYFNQPISTTSFPHSLTHLTFGMNFNRYPVQRSLVTH